MRNHDLPLSSDLKEMVYIIADSDTQYYITAEFEVRPGFFPVLNILNQHDVIDMEKNSDKFTKSLQFIYKSRTFSAINNDINWNAIQPQYIIEGNYDDDKIGSTEIEVFLSGMEIFFLTKFSDSVTTESSLKRETGMRVFETETFTLRNHQVKIGNRYRFSLSKDGRETRLDEFPVLTVHNLDGVFTLNDVFSIIHDLAAFFTCITGAYIGPEGVWIKTENKDSRSVVYSPEGRSHSRPFRNRHELLFFYDDLLENRLIENALVAFFNPDPNQAHINWRRLYGLMSYSNQWDYEVLGITGLLDNFLKSYFENNRGLLKQSRNIPKKIINLIDREIRSLKIVDKNTTQKIISCITDIEYVKPDLTLANRFITWYEQLPVHVQNIFELGGNAFSEIKNVRDGVAHSVTDYDDSNFSLVNRQKYRIQLLLLFIHLGDIGIPEEQILTSFYRSLNWLVRSAELNEKILGKACRPGLFHLVEKDAYKEIINFGRGDIVIEKVDGMSHFDRQKSILIRKEWTTPDGIRYRDVREYVKSMYPEDVHVSYDHGFIETEDGDATQIYGICVVELK